VPLESLAFRPCAVIPCYDHGLPAGDVIARLEPSGLPVILVDDGSGEETRQALDDLARRHPKVRLLRLERNLGKGGAVLHGMREAHRMGFTHAVQIDADGQHAIEDIPRFLDDARHHPDALLSGLPVYDRTMPRARRYGRWITHVWVWIETLSFAIKDSMCGFRVYPIAPTLALAARSRLGIRMDFDTDVMVRLYWQGVDCRFLPIRVTYPPDGVSHFNAVKDNWRISRMHARLFFGMLPRAPSLLRRRRRHWARTDELKGLWGMRVMLAVWDRLGRGAFSALLYPVTAVYWLCAHDARRASQDWLDRVRRTLRQNHRLVPGNLGSYRHFLRFGQAMIDKIAGWRGELSIGKEAVFAPGAEAFLDGSDRRGVLVLASHLGDVETCRALARQNGRPVVNALVFHENARRFQAIIEEVAPQAGLHLLPVSALGPETAVQLKEKLDRGEWVVIVGDRIAVNPQRGGWRVVWSPFLGQPAPFPEGPFILAAALRCPVLTLFALRRDDGRLHLYCEPFADPLVLPRGERREGLQKAVDRYAARLEHYALMAPLDWFNFFDFWRLPAMSPDTEGKE